MRDNIGKGKRRDEPAVLLIYWLFVVVCLMVRVAEMVGVEWLHRRRHPRRLWWERR